MNYYYFLNYINFKFHVIIAVPLFNGLPAQHYHIVLKVLAKMCCLEIFLTLPPIAFRHVSSTNVYDTVMKTVSISFIYFVLEKGFPNQKDFCI